MSCACFTCQLHASDVIPEEDKILGDLKQEAKVANDIYDAFVNHDWK